MRKSGFCKEGSWAFWFEIVVWTDFVGDGVIVSPAAVNSEPTEMSIFKGSPYRRQGGGSGSGGFDDDNDAGEASAGPFDIGGTKHIPIERLRRWRVCSLLHLSLSLSLSLSLFLSLLCFSTFLEFEFDLYGVDCSLKWKAQIRGRVQGLRHRRYRRFIILAVEYKSID